MRLPLDAAESARVVGLRYVSDCTPGVHRRRVGKGFIYFTAAGVSIKDPRQLKRFRALVIPPAWKDVWICSSADGHLQATGRDNRGRKQYRYHALYRRVRNETKFSRMAAFASVLPGIRQRLSADLALPGLPRAKVLATVVSLLERTGIRVGNQEYAEQNKSFGLTTLRDRHVKVGSDRVRFHFRGKSGKVHEFDLEDRKLARIVQQCQQLPGQELFQYLDGENGRHSVGSEDVNAYLREISGEDFSAKDFRTWRSAVEAVIALEAIGPARSRTAARKNIVEAVKIVAGRLGNRPATCRNYYIHPAILEAYESGSFFERIRHSAIQHSKLSREEQVALAIIENSEKKSADIPSTLKQPAA